MRQRFVGMMVMIMVLVAHSSRAQSMYRIYIPFVQPASVSQASPTTPVATQPIAPVATQPTPTVPPTPAATTQLIATPSLPPTPTLLPTPAATAQPTATPALSAPPPKTRLIYTRILNDYRSITLYSVGADGRDEHEQLAVPGHAVTSPAWSPDGSRLLFAYDYGGIAVAHADGGHITLLPQPPDSGSLAGARWSPDGRWIVFASSRASTDKEQDTLFRMRPDGSDIHQITHSSDPSIAWGDDQPSWSPDGAWIVFIHRERGELPQIYKVRVDGSALTHLSTPESCALDPVWSPDGQQIAFTRCGNYPNSAIYTIRPDGSGLTQRTNTIRAFGPAWSPDSKWIAFTDSYTLFLLEVATGAVAAVTAPGNSYDLRVQVGWAPK